MPTSAKPFFVTGRKPLKYQMSGWDVLAMSRALRSSGFRKRPASKNFGWRHRRQITAFQRDRKLTVTGTLTEETMRSLAKYYDGYGVWLIQHQQKASAVNTLTDKNTLAVKAAFLLLAHKDAVHYTQSLTLRFQGVLKKIYPPKYMTYGDCSSTYTWYRFVAGLSDPNRAGYNGTGWTGTLLANGTRTSNPQPGDATFYTNPGHVVIEVGQGYVISHGSEGGPYYLKRDYRTVYQSRTYGA